LNKQFRRHFLGHPHCTSLATKDRLVPLRVARVRHDAPTRCARWTSRPLLMSKPPGKRDWAVATAHLFRQIAQPKTAYLCIPAHVSESRPYFLAARFGPRGHYEQR
jgi:hypothetical protein